MRLLAHILFLLAAPVVLTSAAPSTFSQTVVREICAREPLASGIVGVLAVSSDGDTLACYNDSHCFVPASNLKLLTCGVALDVLGPDFRFRTAIACSGEITNGTLVGNVYIIGDGDPTIAAPGTDVDSLFGIWRRFLDAAGIRRIDGAVIGDGDIFRSLAGSESWSAYDRSRSYGAGVSGLNFYGNSQTFRMFAPRRTGQKVDFAVVYPQTPWMEFSSSCVTRDADKAEGVSYINTAMASRAEFTGSCRAGRGEFEITASNCFPELTCAFYFYNYLNDNGIPVGEYLDGSSRGVQLRHLGSTTSAPLCKIVEHTLKESDNFCAEALLRTIGLKFGAGTVDSGLKAEQEWLRQRGVRVDGVLNAVDGSGLSRKNYASPSFFVRFLQEMARSRAFGSFLQGLPRPGQGTLVQRLPDQDESLRRRIAMKSGSMSGTLCYSGYIFPADGDTAPVVTFSILTNNVQGGSRVTGPMIDRILMTLVEQI